MRNEDMDPNWSGVVIICGSPCRATLDQLATGRTPRHSGFVPELSCQQRWGESGTLGGRRVSPHQPVERLRGNEKLHQYRF